MAMIVLGSWNGMYPLAQCNLHAIRLSSAKILLREHMDNVLRTQNAPRTHLKMTAGDLENASTTNH
eukprot:CAMPEP_0174385286 /NCGR_PEP_ID=MMETSP0811_2-20130205/126495_1 /TAXON_ID=73025 ORGANISM="Eutreptiella gymnastica-like, Strain CCMP1594" /NCGR_SAMPLE_ID=MMETSP0811_2 /ASSEMBLY_ACC=CAM_ASM_000667 /LENGTH=65 /DNA_ID=CAMNT_0015539551 /DNA_START=1390 /DNA_END=1587 /DNA_ORIENTATION=-